MLVLGRKKGEIIKIGDDIYIQVLTIRQGVVRLGIKAPKEIPVVRIGVKSKFKAESKQKDSRC